MERQPFIYSSQAVNLLETELIGVKPLMKAFLLTCYQAGIFNLSLEGKNVGAWEKRLTILATFFFDPEIDTIIALAAQREVSRQAINQSLHQTVADLWQLLSPEQQTRFPLGQLKTQMAKDKREVRIAQRQDLLATLLAQGKNTTEIAEAFGLSTVTLRHDRAAYKIRTGIEGRLTKNKNRISKLLAANNDEQAQRIFNRLDRNDYYSGIRSGDLISVRSFTFKSTDHPENQFHYSTRSTKFFWQALKKAQIPIGKKRIYHTKSGAPRYSYFIRARDKDRALATFQAHPLLRKFLVSNDLPLTKPGEKGTN